MSVIRYTGAGKIVVPRFRDIPTHVPRLHRKVRRSRWKRVLSSLPLNHRRRRRFAAADFDFETV